MITGTLVSESLRVGAEISGVAGMKLVGVRRVQGASGVPPAQIDWPE